MNGLLDKPNTSPVRLANFYSRWSVAIVLMYLIARFIWRRNIGELDFTGIAVGLAIGVLWSLATLIRAFVLARKNIFVNTQNRGSYYWRLIWIIIEIIIPFAIGCCILLIMKANKLSFNLFNAIWSLIYSVFFAFFFVSGIGYYLLEWYFGKKFFDKLDK